MSSEKDGALTPEVVTSGSSLAVITAAEIDAQVATAKQFPRSITKFREEALALATTSEEIAESCMYSIPRAGKRIEGPSVRLAEIVAYTFGNIRYGARIVSVEQDHVVAEGFCHDLEKNVARKAESKRSILNKKGERYNADMIKTTCDAACSIAAREAVFKVVPRALFWEVYEAAVKCAVGDAETLQSRVHKAFDWFNKVGIDESSLLAHLGREGLADITLDDLKYLTGLRTAVKDGGVSVDTIIGETRNDRLAALNAKVKQPEQEAPQEPDDSDLADSRLNERDAKKEAMRKRMEANRSPSQRYGEQPTVTEGQLELE